jgi:flagellar basal body-associated protein FliL
MVMVVVVLLLLLLVVVVVVMMAKRDAKSAPRVQYDTAEIHPVPIPALQD